MKNWLSLGLVSLLMGCATQPATTQSDSDTAPLPTTFYDYTITSPQGQALSISELARALQNADIVLVGEWHGHPGTHLMQAQLFAQLYRLNSDMALSMEQFTRRNRMWSTSILTGKLVRKP